MDETAKQTGGERLERWRERKREREREMEREKEREGERERGREIYIFIISEAQKWDRQNLIRDFFPFYRGN